MPSRRSSGRDRQLSGARNAAEIEEHIDADAIAGGLSAFHPETVAVAAGRLLLRRIRLLAEEGRSFAFESTLSARSLAPWLMRLREKGYRIGLVFMALDSADLAVQRVGERVQSGGYSIPEAVIRRRFRRGLVHLFKVFIPIANEWRVYDNSTLLGPALVARGGQATRTEVVEPHAWSRL